MLSIIAQDPAPMNMQPGQRYLLDNAMAAEYLKGGAPCEPQVYEPPSNPELGQMPLRVMIEDLSIPPLRVLIIRSGAIGDLLFLTPALDRLLSLYPQHHFTLCCLPQHQAILCHPRLDRLQRLDYPPRLDVVKNYDLVVPLEEVMERNNEINAVTVFAQHLGLTLEKDEKTPLLRVPDTDVAEARQRFPRTGSHQVFYGIQLRASVDCRTWPFQHIQALADSLLERESNATVFLFGRQEDFPGIDHVNHPRLWWLPMLELSLAETLAVLSLMDGFVGPDSALLHAAGALGIPSVGLFGPFQWQQRVPADSTIRAVNGHAPCAPCHHQARFSDFPPGMPCQQSRCCLALAQITPDRVASLLRRQVAMHRIPDPATRAAYREHLYPMHSFWGGLQRGDVHPELDRADEYHQGDWGSGAATIEEAKFLYALVLALKPKTCLETGTETGWTAAHIAKALEENGHGHLITLETDPKRVAQARENLRQIDLAHRVDVVEQASHEYLQGLPALAEIIDFALLDTHIELRARELALLVPHLAPGAVVCVHDTHPAHPMAGDTRLLDALRNIPGFDVLHLPTPRGLTVLQRH